MQKSIMTTIMALIILLSMGYNTEAAMMKLDIRVNDMIIKMDSNPYIKEDRTMVPIRAVVEALGTEEVIWNEEDRTATIVLGPKSTTFKIDSVNYWVNNEEKTMGVAPTIVNGRTMLPLRVIAEELAFDVNYNPLIRTVAINNPSVEVSQEQIADNQYNYEDILWLARIVRVEANGIGYEAKLAVANVVLNRVKSGRFPMSIKEVLFDTKYATQFPPAHRESFLTLEPDLESWAAAKNALDGHNNIGQSLFFNHKPFPNKSSDLYRIINGEYFYY
ncbi:stalk domain-containing protein [Petrocella sp. FN5]|uniref:stalk domain-containing protein n=1 Tax=Petrocella sp. FN5 TaxID=3032002 RepID=UPI0023DCB434|nr:stalk domain-containing protein [Petrocella sp. FN5]MDF1615927.1 stalk domain-containing protein [Petrocella sp. FN5]